MLWSGLYWSSSTGQVVVYRTGQLLVAILRGSVIIHSMLKTQSIRELRALQAKALEAYHAEHRRLEAEIQAIRTVRGTKLKEKVFESYHEPGRSRERFPGGQSY